jgi:beta-glucanase (GH16 family)
MPVMRYLSKYLSILAFLFLISCTDWFGRPNASENYDPGPGWNLYWADEFNGTELDMTKWSYDLGAGGWGNDELQGYTSNRENLMVANGMLVIQAQRNSNDYIPFSSARIHTLNKFSFRYGKLVIRMKLPYGLGIWPAFWMMGTNKMEVGWPGCGEFDFVEMKGGGPYGDSIVFSSAHWLSEKTGRHAFCSDQNMNTNPGAETLTLVPFYKDFHVFTMVWTPKAIDTYFENTHIFNMKINTNIEKDMAVYHTDFYLLLNLAVGGTMSKLFMGAMVPGEFPRVMTVDWIRLYKQEDMTGTNKK